MSLKTRTCADQPEVEKIPEEKMNTTPKAPAINGYIAQQAAKFRALSQSRKSKLRAEAREFIAKNPGCADHSNFWRGLSARQVLSNR